MPNANAVATPTFSKDAGTYFGTQIIEISCATAGASIYFTLNGSDPTTSSTLYNSAGIVVSETTTLKAIAVKTGMDDSEVAEATYVIYKNSAAGTVDDPYAVADARAHIDGGTGVEEVYAWGIVSEIVTPFSSEFGNITYNISADGTTTSAQLQAYRGKDKDGASFTSENDVQVGDYVVVFGNLQKHGDTYEFAQDNQRVDYSRNTVATPTITPDGGTFYGPVEVTIACETPDVTIEYVLDNGEGDLVTPIIYTGPITISETTTLKAVAYIDEENYSTIATATFTIDVPAAAVLPFEFDGGRDDIANTDGLTQEGLGTNYSNSPYLKFDGTGDYVLLHFDEAPGKLFFDVKGNPGSSPWSGTFKVQTSADGVTFTNLKTYTEFGNNVLSEEITDLASDVRYIKWVYTEKVSGNVALGNIYLERYTTIATPTITPDGGSFFGPVEVTIECQTPGVTIEYSFENGEGGITPSFTYTGPITISESKTLVAYAYTDDDYSNDATATFTIVELEAAELPFAYDGDGTGTLPDGLVQEGLGKYDSSPAMKFDGTGDFLLLHFDETPGTLTFEVKGNGFSGGTFTVQTSADGVTFTDLESYTELDDIQNEEFDLASDVRYIKWVYTEKASGNVALGNINLTKYSTVATPTFDPDGGTFVESVEVAIACDTPGATIEYYFENGEGGVSLSSPYTGPITISESTTLVAYAYIGDDYSVATATFTIATPMTIAEARAQETGEAVLTKGVVTSRVGITAFIQDATAAICVYGQELTVGDEIAVLGTLKSFNGLLEITDPTPTILSSGNTVTPEVMTIAAVNSSSKQGWLVKIEDAIVTAIDGQNTTIVQGENTIAVRGISDVEYGVGDVITLTGNIGCFNNTPQIVNPTNVVVTPVLTPSITVTPATNDVPGLAGEFGLSVSIENLDNPDGVGVTFYEDAEGNTETTYEWIGVSSVNAEAVMLYVDDNDYADRTAYLRVFASVGADVFSSNVVTINQAKYVAPSVATLPFVYDGDGTGNLPDGLAQEGLGVKTYSSSPKMGFDTTGDYLLLQFDERPGVLSYDIKGNGFSEGTFTVQTSADGVTFSTLETYTELGATQSEQFMTLDADVRYIKWIYTEKKNGNVALGNITLAKYVEIPTYTISFDKMTNISVTADDGIFAIEEGDELYEGITVYLTVDPAAGYILDELFVTTVGEVDVETTYISLNRYSFEMPNDDVYIYASAKEDVSTLYTLATSINPGKHYIVVGKNDTEFYAMGKDKGNNRAAVAVRQSGDDGVRVDPEAEVYEFVVSGCSAGYVFYDENEASTGYLYAASSDKNYLKTTNAEVLPDDNAKWTISFGTNGSATIKAQGDKERNLMRFNSSGSNALFACYGSGQQDVYLYVRDGDESSEPESFYKTITNAGWATLCLPFTAETPEGVTAYAVTGADDSVLEKEEIEDGVPANTGVLLKGDAGMVKFVKNDGLKLHVPEGNCLVGTTEGATFEGDELGGTYYYILANDESKGIGFYWQKGTGGTSANCEPYKAVLELHFKGAPAIGFRLDDATMVETVKAMEENAVIYDLTGRRVTNVTRGIYIVNGKKVMVK